MRIGISGAQSVGKTTLLHALRSEEVFKGYPVCDEVTRTVKRMGFDINTAGSDATQTMIMMMHIQNIFLNPALLTDRTSLDGLVYTTWLYANAKVSTDTLMYAKRVFLATIQEYDRIYYIRPEFDIVGDGVRSDDKAFQEEIVELFEDTIDEYELPVILLSGSVRERVEEVLRTIDASRLNNLVYLKE